MHLLFDVIKLYRNRRVFVNVCLIGVQTESGDQIQVCDVRIIRAETCSFL